MLLPPIYLFPNKVGFQTIRCAECEQTAVSIIVVAPLSGFTGTVSSGFSHLDAERLFIELGKTLGSKPPEVRHSDPDDSVDAPVTWIETRRE